MGKTEKARKIASSEGFWSDIAKDYLVDQYQEIKEYPALLVRHQYILDLFNPSDKAVLDIGCGPGEMIIDLVKQGCTASGVDIAEGMIEVARKNIGEKIPDSHVELQVGDIEKLEFENNKFDSVICSGVIEYLSTDDIALAELNRVMRKGGTLIITVRNRICPARFIDIFTDIIKESSWGLSLLNKLKRMAQGKETPEIVFTPYRKHYPGELDKNLKRYGFNKEDFRYYHFYPFFVPFDKIFPNSFVKSGLKMEKLANSKLGWLGSGYIVKARKVKEL